MGLAMDVATRNFLLLAERSLGPEAMPETGGRAATRYWNIDGFTEAAICGALHKGGIGLFGAARLANLLMLEEASTRGRFPSRLQDLYRGSKLPPPDKTDDFWLHRHLRMHGGAYVPRKAVKGDFLVEIVDRKYVLSGKMLGLAITYADGRESSALCRIETWSRDDISIVPASVDVGVPLDGTQRSLDAIELMEATYAEARKNAVSVLQVNMSLAIRTALDNVMDYREAQARG